MINYYEILGIESTATLSEIGDAIKALRKTARKRSGHPDTEIRHEAEMLIEKLSEAETIFNDESSREEYDKELEIYLRQERKSENSKEEYNHNDYNDTDELNDILVQYRRVQKYLDRGQADLARRALSEITSNDPKILLFKGKVSIMLGNTTDGIYELDKYIETDSTNPKLYHEVADILYDSDIKQEAIQYLLEATNYSSDYSTYSRLGFMYANTDQYDRAIETFNQIDLESLEPSNASYINYCLAYCYNRKELPTRAIEHADKSISLVKDNYEAIYEKILSYDELGKLNEVADLVEESYINSSRTDLFNYYVLKVRVYKGSIGMTKVRTTYSSILSQFNNLDYIVASKEDLSKAENLRNNLIPLLDSDDTGLVKKEIDYLDSQINYTNKKVKNDIGKLKIIFFILVAVIIFSSESLVVKVLQMSVLGFLYYKLSYVPGYVLNKKKNKGRIIKE